MDSPSLCCLQLFEEDTSTCTYLLADPGTHTALIIDPVLEATERDLQRLQERGLKLLYVLETHLHADHVTGASELRAVTGARVAVSRMSGIREADLALDDGARVTLGDSQILCIATPGHTPACLSYYTEGMVFTGDCLLVGATGRTDLPGGDAAVLFDSIHRRLWSLPAATRVYPAHEYGGYRNSTIEHESRFNARANRQVKKEDFIKLMAARRPPPARMP